MRPLLFGHLACAACDQSAATSARESPRSCKPRSSTTPTRACGDARPGWCNICSRSCRTSRWSGQRAIAPGRVPSRESPRLRRAPHNKRVSLPSAQQPFFGAKTVRRQHKAAEAGVMLPQVKFTIAGGTKIMRRASCGDWWVAHAHLQSACGKRACKLRRDATLFLVRLCCVRICVRWHRHSNGSFTVRYPTSRVRSLVHSRARARSSLSIQLAGFTSVGGSMG